MRKQTFSSVCLLLLIHLIPCTVFSKTTAGYVIRPSFSPPSNTTGINRPPLVLQVSLTFKGSAEGRTWLKLPGRAGTTDHLFRCIRNVSCDGLAFSLLPDSSQALIEYEPGDQVQVTYEVWPDGPANSVTSANCFRPILQDDYFLVMGQALFLLPLSEDGYAVTLDWRGFPSDWVMHNSFGTQQLTQHFESPDPHWTESVFLGGDFRLLQTEVKGQPVWLALRGEWNFEDAWLTDMLRETVEVQRQFWAMGNPAYYTAVLLPLAPLPICAAQQGSPYHQSSLGTGLQNSFVAFATPNLDERGMSILFNHEMMHDWLGCRLRDGYPAGDQQMAWFTEGFAEYFAWKNMVRAGLLSVDEYVDVLNQDFFTFLYHSSVKTVPNQRIAAGFASRYDMRQQAYKRGGVFAFYLDNAIRVASNDKQDLHDFARDLLAHYVPQNQPIRSDLPFFMDALSRFTGKDARALHQRFIEKGELIPPADFVLPHYWNIEADQDGVPVLRLNKRATGWEMALTR